VTAITAEFLHLVDRVAASIALPAVAAIHLLPATATGHSAGFCALELADGSIGLSYLWLGYGRERLRDVLAELPLPGDPRRARAGTATLTPCCAPSGSPPSMRSPSTSSRVRRSFPTRRRVRSPSSTRSQAFTGMVDRRAMAFSRGTCALGRA
jgi:hypothetical protein